MGVNTQQDDYYENLFRRTTASYRAKHSKENIAGKDTALSRHRSNNDNLPTTSKQAHAVRQRILQERNHSQEGNSTTDNSFETRPTGKSDAKPSPGIGQASIKHTVEGMVANILQERFSNATATNAAYKPVNNDNAQKVTFMDPIAMKSVVSDLVNKILKKQLKGDQHSNDSFGSKPLKSVIEDIVAEKLKEHFTKIQSCSNPQGNAENVDTSNIHIQHASNLPKARLPLSNLNKTLDSQTLMAELLADNKPQSQSKGPLISKQLPPKSRCGIPDPEQVSCVKGTGTGIKRLPRSESRGPEWADTDDKTRQRSASTLRDGRAHSPAQSSSGRSSRSHLKGTGVLIPRSTSHGRSRKPNNADPVALYQYYKNEWDYFRKQIPGENNHNRLRWHVRQRLLDPE